MEEETMSQTEDRWTKHAKSKFVGKKIVGARYMSEKEADDMGWSKRPVVLQLSDGTLFYPSMDDEGNDGGAMFAQNKKGEDIGCPVI